MKEPSLISGLDPAALFEMAGATEADAASDWKAPTPEEAALLFPQWRMIRLLGRGGMGAVYQMHQPDLDRDVAVKLLPIEACRDERQVERFRREARTLAKLRHPGIVSLHESGLTPAGHFYFVMEYVDGSTLGDLIAKGKVDVAKAIAVTTAVCEALAYAHGLGVVHRDIKPSNILVDAEGRAKVADFGLARVEQASALAGALDLSRTGTFMGTPAYAAPEQLRDAARADHRADIYALGVLLYEMLTGELPRGVFQPPSRKSGSDSRLDGVVKRALQERPEDRYQAAAEFRQDVAPAARTQKHGRSLAVIAISSMLILLGGAWLWKHSDREPDVHQAAPPPASSSPASSGAVLPDPASILPSMEKEQEKPVTRPALPEPAASLAKEAPEPMIPAATTKVKVWSADPLPPSLQPPAELLRMPWLDAVLLGSGGVVLHPDGVVSSWNENSPGKIVAVKIEASAIAWAGEASVALDRKSELHRISPDGTTKRLAGGISAVFPSAHEDLILAVSEGRRVVIIHPSSGKIEDLPWINPLTMAATADGKIWAANKDRQLYQFKDGSWSPETASSKVKQLAAGDQLLVLEEGGSLRAISGSLPAGLSALMSIEASRGCYLATDSSGRCILWGAALTEAPLKFRKAEGITRQRVSPRGMVAEW